MATASETALGPESTVQVRAGSTAHPERSSAAWRPAAWYLLLPIALVVYATSFSSFGIIERKHSVLGDADAANYVDIFQRFHLNQKLGNEWTAHGRSIGDNAQKHKLHHILYAAIGSTTFRMVAPVYRLLGLPPERAMYAVNALIGLLNIVLLAMLLRRRGSTARNPSWPFLLFYAAALSTWVFNSVPESWPFSATLVLAFMLLLQRQQPLSPLWLGAILGVIMLNNVFLAALGVMLALQCMRLEPTWTRAARSAVLAGGVALVTWTAGLSALSLFDDSFRPDRFVGYTLWFKDYTGATLPRTDPYVWQSAATNLFVNSVVSNQPDPAVPQEALKSTLLESRLGLAATLTYLMLAGLVTVRFLRSVFTAGRGEGWRALLRERSLDYAVWCGVMLGVTVVLFYASGFLYSTVVVPVLAVLLSTHLDWRVRWERALLCTVLLLVVVNNVYQVLAFRDALTTMS